VIFRGEDEPMPDLDEMNAAVIEQDGREAKEFFNLGARVRDRKSTSREVPRAGVVVGYSRDGMSLRIKFDHRAAIINLSPSWVETASEAADARR
jgi:hypothetical protein